MSSRSEHFFAAVAGFIVSWTGTSMYWRQKAYRVKDIHMLEEQRDYHAEKAVEFAEHEATSRKYEIQAQVYREAIKREEENLNSVYKTFFGTGAYIPDIEREASERWRAEFDYD